MEVLDGNSARTRGQGHAAGHQGQTAYFTHEGAATEAGTDSHGFGIGAQQHVHRAAGRHAVDTVLDRPEGVIAKYIAGAIGGVVYVHIGLIAEIVVDEHCSRRHSVRKRRRTLATDLRIVIPAAVDPGAAGTVLPGADPVGHPVDGILVGDLIQRNQRQHRVRRGLPVLVVGIDTIGVVHAAVAVLARQEYGHQTRNLGRVHTGIVERIDQTGYAQVVPPEVGVGVGRIEALVVDDVEIARIVVEGVLIHDLGHGGGVGVVAIAGITIVEHSGTDDPGRDVPGDDTVGITLAVTSIPDVFGQSLSRTVDNDLGIILGPGGVHVRRATDTGQIVVVHQENHVRTRVDIGIGEHAGRAIGEGRREAGIARGDVRAQQPLRGRSVDVGRTRAGAVNEVGIREHPIPAAVFRISVRIAVAGVVLGDIRLRMPQVVASRGESGREIDQVSRVSLCDRVFLLRFQQEIRMFVDGCGRRSRQT